MTSNSRKNSAGLRPNCLSPLEIFAQSFGNISPAAMPAVSIPLVSAHAGNGTWLVFVIATVGLVLVGMNINQFARRSAYPGSLYGSIATTLGPTAGILSGWSLILAYLFTAMTVSCGFVIYLSLVMSQFGLQVPPLLLFGICTALVWYYAYSDVQLSMVVTLILEVTAVVIISFLALLVLGKYGFPIDNAQITLKDVTPEGIRLGLVLAIFSYVGFESATTLGTEAKQPLQSIPKAVVLSALIAGLVYVFLSYAEVFGFSVAGQVLHETTTPLSFLAKQAGVELLGVAISASVTFSFFTCALASVNAGSRIAFSLARHGIFHASLGRTHLQNETPHIAVTLAAVVVFLVPASLSLFGVPVLQIYDYLGTLATFGFLLVYILISIAAPIDLRRRGKLRQKHLVISGIAILLMLLPIAASLYPIPEFPLNILPYLFLMYLVVGAGLFVMLQRQFPQVVEDMERNLDSLHNLTDH